MMDRRTYEGLAAFAKIVELGSFVRAAAQLGVTPSALSQLINQLEAAIGTRLLHRTSRSVAPTAVGTALLSKLGPALASLDDALATTREERATGPLRISSSRIAAELVIAPRLGAFTLAYPDVQLELVIDDRLVDVVANRFDAGLRLGEMLDRDMIAVEVGGHQRLVVVATPAYWATHGKPRHPRDLLAHRCVVNLMPNGGHYRWELERDGTELELAVRGPTISNDPRICELAILAGCGAGFVFEGQAAPHLASGALEAVLHAWCPSFPGFHLYYPSRRVSPALRGFVDVLRAKRARSVADR